VDFAAHGTELHVTAGSRLLLDGPFPQPLVLITAGRGRVRCAGETIAELGPAISSASLRRAGITTRRRRSPRSPT
jgi:hypothetical protein